MSRNPYFPFYPADFMTGIRGLTPAEVGIYTMLLCRMYEEDGPIEANSTRLASYCGTRLSWFERAVARLVELGKILTDGNTLWNTRAMAEIEQRRCKSDLAARAGKISAEKRQQNQQSKATDVQRTFNHTDTDKKEEKSSVAKATDADGVADFNEAIWTRGVAYLVRNGVAEKNARSILGKWRKKHGDKAIYEALSASARAGASDPVAYVTKAMVDVGDQKLEAWGIPDAKPVRVEPRVEYSGTITPTGEADVPELLSYPEGWAPTHSVPVGNNDDGWSGSALPPLRLVLGGVL